MGKMLMSQHLPPLFPRYPP